MKIISHITGFNKKVVVGCIIIKVKVVVKIINMSANCIKVNNGLEYSLAYAMVYSLEYARCQSIFLVYSF